MGILDRVTSVIGEHTGSINIDAIVKWIDQLGGVSALMNKFNQSGLANIIESWIGKGENLPISGDQIKQILGSDSLKELASKLGQDESQTSSLLATYLPKIINRLSSDGQETSGEASNLISKGIDFLKDKL